MPSQSRNFMSPTHIQKLGHEIQEIRSRALRCISTKYNMDLVDENNIEISHQLLDGLLNWFSNNHSDADNETALKLILRLSKSKTFSQIVQKTKPDVLLKHLSEIEKNTDGNLLPLISEIKDNILKTKNTNENWFSSKISLCECPERTTEPIETVVLKKEEKLEQTPIEPVQFLPWQSLSSPDKKILLSSFEKLRYVDDVPAILRSCQFLKDVVLKDFAAEIFLQRPLVLRTLLELLNSKVPEIRISVLNVLKDLTESLGIRIRMCLDPNIRGKKYEVAYENDTNIEETAVLKRYQMSIPEFGTTLLSKSFNLILSTLFLEERKILLEIIVGIIKIQSSCKDNSKSIINSFEPILAKFSENSHDRLIYVSLLTSMLSRLQNSNDLSTNIRSQLFKCVGDPSLILFFPGLHDLIIGLVGEIQDKDAEILTKDLSETLQICSSMEVAIEICNGSKRDFQSFALALPSLEFHKNLKFIKDFFKMCLQNNCGDDKFRNEVLLLLLAHEDEDLREVVYAELSSLMKKIWMSENLLGRASFLFLQEVWIEIIGSGTTSGHPEIRKNCHEILMTVFDSHNNCDQKRWTHFLSSLEPVLPLLAVFGGANDPLGRAIVRLFEPSVAQNVGMPVELVILGNLRLLFCKEILVNEEAFARLCWLLAKDDAMGKKLPKISEIKNLHLSSVCISVKPSPDHPPGGFSTLRLLNETMATINDPTSSPSLRRLALTKLTDILDDPTLRHEFLENNGLHTLLDLLNKSLLEAELSYYPDSVTSIVSILKKLVISFPEVRKELSSNISVILNILRSLFLFASYDAFRRDAVQLLYLLAFSKVISGNEWKIKLPGVLVQKLHHPMEVLSNSNSHTRSSNSSTLMSNPNVARLLRVYWSALWLGDVASLISLTKEDLENDVFSPGLPIFMKPTVKDLENLKFSAVRHVLRLKLEEIETADSHDRVLNVLHQLSSCLTWVEMSSNLLSEPGQQILSLTSDANNLDSLPWAASFSRFLTLPPSCMEDEKLLSHVVLLFRHVVRAVDSPDVVKEITELLTHPKGVFVQLLKNFETTAHGLPGREVCYGLVHLAEDVIQRTDCESNPDTWVIVAEIILTHLESGCGDHLDCLMSLLADITGAWSWEYEPLENLYRGLLKKVIEVIVSFKGVPESQHSFMGSNIINNALIVLGHLLADLSSKTKGWEQVWREALHSYHPETSDLEWLVALCRYRDPMTRAAAFTLIAGLFSTSQAFNVLVDGFHVGVGAIWTVSWSAVMDSGECSLVKEKAVFLMEKLVGLGAKTDGKDFLEYIKKENLYNIFGDMAADLKGSLDSFPENSNLVKQSVTFNLVTAICNCMQMILKLNKPDVAMEISKSQIWKSALLVVALENNQMTREYLRMNAAIIKLMCVCVKHSSEARKRFLANDDALKRIIHLLSIAFFVPPKIQNQKLLPELEHFYQETFYLISIILETPDGIGKVKKSFPKEDLANFLTVILNCLDIENLRFRCLIFVNNLATVELSEIFETKFEESSFAENLCEKLLTIDLSASAVTLASLMLVQPSAQVFASRHGLAETILLQLRKIADKINVYVVGDLRKMGVRKRVEPYLDTMEALYQLLCNFCYRNASVKLLLADSGLAVSCQKLWHWVLTRPSLLETTLKLLCTFTYQSERACQSLAISSAHPTRKSTLLHSIISLITSEMEEMNKTKGLTNINLALQVVSNSCIAVECRAALVKGELLNCLDLLSPSNPKKKTVSENLLHIWMHFMDIFTAFPEGQLIVAQNTVALELIQHSATGSSTSNRTLALRCLTHMSLFPQNRCRLLISPAPLLNLLIAVLKSDHENDIQLAGAIVWALTANSQKNKLLFRTAGFSDVLNLALKSCKDQECLRVLEQALLVLV